MNNERDQLVEAIVASDRGPEILRKLEAYLETLGPTSGPAPDESTTKKPVIRQMFYTEAKVAAMLREAVEREGEECARICEAERAHGAAAVIRSRSDVDASVNNTHNRPL